MAMIGSKDHLVRAKREFKRSFATITTQAADSIRGDLVRLSDTSGKILPLEAAQARVAVGRVVSDVFTGRDNLRAYDGLQPLSPYATAFNDALVGMHIKMVHSHSLYMRRRLAKRPDVVQWLESWRRPLPEQIIANPFAEYNPAHTWVDPDGYRLSDRIWRSGERTRAKIDRIVAAAVREGMGSLRTAELLESSLRPDRKAVRTRRPYNLDASFDGMRLARTEMGRAHSFASRTMNLANPYVEGEDFALSITHPKIDICDTFATLGKGGGRIKQPYPKGQSPIPIQDTHPQCQCAMIPFVTQRPALIDQELIVSYERGDAPPATPLAQFEFLRGMLGELITAAAIASVLGGEDAA